MSIRSICLLLLTLTLTLTLVTFINIWFLIFGWCVMKPDKPQGHFKTGKQVFFSSFFSWMNEVGLFMNIDHVDNIKAKSGGNRNLEQSVLQLGYTLSQVTDSVTFWRIWMKIIIHIRIKEVQLKYIHVQGKKSKINY